MNRRLLRGALLGTLFLGFPSMALALSPAFEPLFAISWLSDLYHEFQLLLTSRKGMMIFSTLIVAAGLWVIWYRRN